MSWERFEYICRKANAECHDNERIADCLTRIEQEPTLSLYGSFMAENSRPRQLLNGIAQMKDKSLVKEVLSIYSQLKLRQQLEMPSDSPRILSYLLQLTLVFFVIAAVYHYKVFPSLYGAFDTFNIQPPTPLLLYREYWDFFFISITLLLGFSFWLNSQLSRLFLFTIGKENSFFLRYLVSKKIRQSYLNIVEILQFPLTSQKIISGSFTKQHQMIDHLVKVKNSKLSLPIEMKELIEIEMTHLHQHAEKQVKFLTSLAAFIISFAIMSFVVSAYIPIFHLGDIV